jgi:hypothetical protein
VKNNAKWWVAEQIDDSDFISGLQHLIKEGIVSVPTTQITGDGNEQIPNWIKNNAEWWSQGLISDKDFTKGIEYLVKQGIIKV